jgi:hypothetical protein
MDIHASPTANNNPTNTYIGSKLIRATKMLYSEYHQEKHLVFPSDTDDYFGYRVEYPDNYISWSPAYVFETAYRYVTSEEMKLICS